jgi:hypothetical protein
MSKAELSVHHLRQEGLKVGLGWKGLKKVGIGMEHNTYLSS